MLSRRPLVSATALLLAASIAITSAPTGASGSFFDSWNKPKNVSKVPTANTTTVPPISAAPTQRKSSTPVPAKVKPVGAGGATPEKKGQQKKPALVPLPSALQSKDPPSNSSQAQPTVIVIENPIEARSDQNKQPSITPTQFIIEQAPEKTLDNNVVYRVDVADTLPLLISKDDANSKVYSQRHLPYQLPEGPPFLNPGFSSEFPPLVPNSYIPPPFFRTARWTHQPYYAYSPWGYREEPYTSPYRNFDERQWSRYPQYNTSPYYGRSFEHPWGLHSQYPSLTRQSRHIQPMYYSPVWYGQWYAPPVQMGPWVQQEVGRPSDTSTPPGQQHDQKNSSQQAVQPKEDPRTLQPQYPSWTRQSRHVPPVNQLPMWYGQWYSPPVQTGPWGHQQAGPPSDTFDQENVSQQFAQPGVQQVGPRTDAQVAENRVRISPNKSDSPLRVSIETQNGRPAPRPVPVSRQQYSLPRQQYPPSRQQYPPNAQQYPGYPNYQHVRHGHHYPYYRHPTMTGFNNLNYGNQRRM